MKNIVLSLLMAIALGFNANAQFNLKEKLNRKADQVAEDFLFGKKKKKNKDEGSTSSSSEENYEYESYDNDGGGGEETSLEDYKDVDVDWSSVEPSKVVHFNKLLAALPNSTNGFRLHAKPEGATVRFGEYNYSSASKELTNGDEKITLMLLDYKDVSSLYASSAQAYSYETTEGKSESIKVMGYDGQYMEDYDDKSATLMLFVKGRYLYSVNGRGVSKNELISISQNVKLDRLP